MGIKGLNKVIRKLAPHIIREKHIGNYVNSRIAIDSSILIYKYRYGKAAYGETGLSKDSDNSHVLGFIQKACFYLRRGIVPVFVFDGKPPNEKQNILDKRSNQKIKIQVKMACCNSTLARWYSFRTNPLHPHDSPQTLGGIFPGLFRLRHPPYSRRH
jgi:flap endonuclease-1